MNRDAFALRPEMVGAFLLALAGLTLSSFAVSDGVFLRWALLLVELTGWGYYLVWLAFAYPGLWLIRRFGLENRAERWEKPADVLAALLTVFTALDLVYPRAGGLAGGLARLLLGDVAAWLVLPIGLAGTVILLGPWGARDAAFLAGREIEDAIRRYRQVPVNGPALPARHAPAPLWITSTAVALPVIADILTAGSGDQPNHTLAREYARRIEVILAGQSIPARVREVNIGPVVTRFAVEPGFTGAGANRRRVAVHRMCR